MNGLVVGETDRPSEPAARLDEVAAPACRTGSSPRSRPRPERLADSDDRETARVRPRGRARDVSTDPDLGMAARPRSPVRSSRKTDRIAGDPPGPRARLRMPPLRTRAGGARAARLAGGPLPPGGSFARPGSWLFVLRSPRGSLLGLLVKLLYPSLTGLDSRRRQRIRIPGFPRAPSSRSCRRPRTAPAPVPSDRSRSRETRRLR